MLFRRALLQRHWKTDIRLSQWNRISIQHQVRSTSTDTNPSSTGETPNSAITDTPEKASETLSIPQSKESEKTTTKPIIRTLFYVPGSSEKMIAKAWTLTPDNIVASLL
jgi:hypothetical protein